VLDNATFVVVSPAAPLEPLQGPLFLLFNGGDDDEEGDDEEGNGQRN